MYRIIVAGSRDFSNYSILKASMDDLLSSLLEEGEDIIIVSGTARGADRLGERYARERGLKVHRFPADWSQGKKAGYIRNVQMAENADACVCFWDGKSRGTKHMIDIAKERDLTLVVIDFNGLEVERWTL